MVDLPPSVRAASEKEKKGGLVVCLFLFFLSSFFLLRTCRRWWPVSLGERRYEMRSSAAVVVLVIASGLGLERRCRSKQTKRPLRLGGIAVLPAGLGGERCAQHPKRGSSWDDDDDVVHVPGIRTRFLMTKKRPWRPSPPSLPSSRSFAHQSVTNYRGRWRRGTRAQILSSFFLFPVSCTHSQPNGASRATMRQRHDGGQKAGRQKRDGTLSGLSPRGWSRDLRPRRSMGGRYAIGTKTCVPEICPFW